MSLKVVDFTFQFQDLAEGPTGFLASSGQLLQSLQDALILAVFELMQQTTADGGVNVVEGGRFENRVDRGVSRGESGAQS